MPQITGPQVLKTFQKINTTKTVLLQTTKKLKASLLVFLLSFVFMLYNNNNNNNCNNNNNINIFLQKCLVNIRIYVTNLYNHCILLEI